MWKFLVVIALVSTAVCKKTAERKTDEKKTEEIKTEEAAKSSEEEKHAENPTLLITFDPIDYNKDKCTEKACLTGCWKELYRTDGYCYNKDLCVCYNKE